MRVTTSSHGRSWPRGSSSRIFSLSRSTDFREGTEVRNTASLPGPQRTERVAKKVEQFASGVFDRRLLFVQCQAELLETPRVHFSAFAAHPRVKITKSSA